MPAEPIVHIIDDDAAVRDALGFLLRTAGLAAKTYESAQSFLDQPPAAAPGCIVTDIRMPEMNGLELVQRLNALGSSLPVIVITGHADVSLAVEAMRAGVVDFIEKPFGDETILAALRGALGRVHNQQQQAAERAAVVQRMAALTTRERQVLNGLVAGQSNKAVARTLDISPRTVEVYRANLMIKMDAESLSALVRMALTAEGRP